MNCLVCKKECKYNYCSLSCSNTGRIVKNIIKYNENPKLCLKCQSPIGYEKRWDKTFCSRTCSASFNNKKRPKKLKVDHKLLNINNKLLQFNLGNIARRGTLRKYIILTKGPNCDKCKKLPIWEGQSLTLIVDHIDGNAGNNNPYNLRLLCPNCNSQTSTFCGRNKGNGRGSRGLPKS